MLRHYLTVLIVLVFAFLFYQWGDSQYQKGIEKQRIESMEALQEKQVKIDELARGFEDVKTQTDAIIVDMRTTHDSLRKQAREAAKRTTTACPDVEGVATSWELFEESAARYAEMAKTADEQRDELEYWQSYYDSIK